MDWKTKTEIIVTNFFETRKNSNCLLELEELLLSTDVECVLTTLDAVSTVFSKVFSKGFLSSSSDKNKDYKLWLLNRYEDFISHLISYLSHENNEIQVSSLKALMLFVQLESKYPCRDGVIDKIFPFTLFRQIVSALLSDDLDQSRVILAFEEYSCYNDIKLYSLKALKSYLNESDEVSNFYLQNCISLLCSIKFPQDFDSSSPSIFTENQAFQLKEKPFRKMFSSAWGCILDRKLPQHLLQRVLAVLDKNVLPHLQNPCLLTDFLSNAYNSGGVMSLLALKGLFILMDRYNLEYPDFFIKLYALLDPRIINGKFGTQFFYLSNLFLSSTHLSANVVAAFAKKLARVSLFSNPANVLKILSLLSNILSGHPSLEKLLHTTQAQESAEDCFNEDAKDPAKSNAVQSSLWEIKCLRSHINPEVCCKAKELTDCYPKFATDMPKNLLHDLYKKQRKRKFEAVPLAIQKPYVKQKKIL